MQIALAEHGIKATIVDNLANLRFQDAIADVRARRDPFEEKMFELSATLYEQFAESAACEVKILAPGDSFDL